MKRRIRRTRTLKGAAYPTGMVARWDMDEGADSTVYDDGANSSDGTFVDGASWASGDMGTVVAFDGDTDSISVPNGVTGVSSAASVSVWFRLTSASTTTSRYLFKLNNAGLLLYGRSTIRFMTDLDGGSLAAASISIDQGTWYHWVGTCDGTAVKQYLDTAEIQDGTATATLDMATPSASIIGALSTTGTLEFEGELSRLAVFDRIISADDIASLYNV